MKGENKMGKIKKIFDKLNYKNNSESEQLKGNSKKIMGLPFKSFLCDMSNKCVDIMQPCYKWDIIGGDTIGQLTEVKMIRLDNPDIYFPMVSDIVLNYEEMVLELYKAPVFSNDPEQRPAICAKVPLYIESIYGDNHSVETFKNIEWGSVYKIAIDIENEKIWLFDNFNRCIVYVNIEIYGFMKELYKNNINEIREELICWE